MNQITLENILEDLPLGEVRYYDRVESTNDIAGEWVEKGVPDFSLLVSDEQTAGRGRTGRRWVTRPGGALALSLILYPTAGEVNEAVTRFTGLGAMAVCRALRDNYSLPAQIKWPNDVLVCGRKLAGILVEAQWSGDRITGLILGIGVNVSSNAVPEVVDFPATCVETAIGQGVDRWNLLHHIIEELTQWRPLISSPEFIKSWEANLAFRGESVQIKVDDETHLEGMVIGLNPDGSLRLDTSVGKRISLRSGEIHLRPVDKPPK
jgi:BirA family biotin operon repressor/biotin-[acetyl-CoA-carboxylase] ligase